MAQWKILFGKVALNRQVYSFSLGNRKRLVLSGDGKGVTSATAQVQTFPPRSTRTTFVLNDYTLY